MMSEPWVSTTFPSKVETFLASSEIMLLASMLIGLSRSALSASADPAANAHVPPRPRAIDGAATGCRDEVTAVSGNLNEAWIKRFARTVVGKMHHLWRRECVPELARGVQPLDGEVFDDRIGIVPRRLCVRTRALQQGVLQPQGHQPEERHQNEREEGSNARFHASWRAMARSSVSWARMISSQTSRAAPLPPGARVTWWTRSRTSSGASGTLAAKPQRASTGRSNQSSPM